jgi:hypothetical protein
MLKGALIMNLISLTNCCHLLAIDPKTLRRWMSMSGLEAMPCTSDARIKCLNREQLTQLAATHRRTLEVKSELHIQPQSSVPATPQSPPPLPTASPVLPDATSCMADLTAQLVCLQAQIVLLHHQLTVLNEQLHQDQPWRANHVPVGVELSQENSLDSARSHSQDLSLESSLAKSLHPSQEKPLKQSLESSLDNSQDLSLESSLEQSQGSSLDNSQVFSQDQSLESSKDLSQDKGPAIDRRKHPRVLPLVEYGGEGQYVVITPEQGKLELSPNSLEWFTWLSTLPSFRFVGQQGHFTAFRGYQCSPRTPWWAHRQIRNHSHKRRLGVTLDVSIESLEMAAASLQALI